MNLRKMYEKKFMALEIHSMSSCTLKMKTTRKWNIQTLSAFL